MICLVYRRKRIVHGKPVLARLYRGRYRLDNDSKITDVALKTADKRVAQERLKQIVTEKQMEETGIIPTSPIRTAAQSALQEHLTLYLADLRALNRDDQYVYELKNRIGRLMKECAWKRLRDITPESFQTWRARQSLSPKTLNEYLGSISSLLNWMEKHGRIARNPLEHVQKVQARGVQVRPRRAFTDDEMQRLLDVAKVRKVVYLAAVHTGLRRGELAALELPDLRLDVDKPFINVRASTTKNHQQAIIALHPELVAELRTHITNLPARETRVFFAVMPTMEQFKADLTAAGIPFLNASGYRADFHSLRHTLSTNLARAGTAPRVAMEIMRHSDIRLTAKTYTDAGLLPVADAVLKLPYLAKPKGTGTQNLVPVGPDQSKPVSALSFPPLPQAAGNEEASHKKVETVTASHELAGVRGTGFEPVTSRV